MHVLFDGLRSRLAQTRFIHRDEPLARGPEDDGLMATPAMRVAVIDVLMHDQHAALAEPLDDNRVGFVDFHSAERAAEPDALALVEMAVIVDRHDDRHIELHASQVVVNTMARSGVDDASTVFHSDVIGIDENAFFALVGENRLLVTVVSELGAVHLPTINDCGTFPTEFIDELLGECFGHDDGTAVVGHCDVILFWMQDDCIVSR